MKKILLLPLVTMFLTVAAQDDTTAVDTAILRQQTEAITALAKRASDIKFQTGPITLENGIGLNVLSGYKFIPRQ